MSDARPLNSTDVDATVLEALRAVDTKPAVMKATGLSEMRVRASFKRLQKRGLIRLGELDRGAIPARWKLTGVAG